MRLLCFAAFHFLRQLWQNGQGISNDAQISNREDGCMLIFIDGHDILGTLHPRQVLNSPTDTASNIERWFDGLAGLTNLVAVGQPASIDDSASRTCRASQSSSQLLDEVEVVRLA